MTTKFVIVGAARTGSTLLVKTLNTIDGVCCHGELLGPDNVRGYEDGFDLVSASKSEREARSQRLRLERNSDPVGFIDRALTRDSRASGFKALYSAFLSAQWRDVIAFLQAIPDIRFIHLTRKNTLRRYISEQILLAGGPNHSGAGGKSEIALAVQVDIDAFLRNSAHIAAQAKELGALLSEQPVLDITYEELAATTAATVTRVCRFLDLEIMPSDIKPALQKVGAVNLSESVSNYQELLDHPVTRALALTD
jgi:LPS sulfotransferase NodH